MKLTAHFKKAAQNLLTSKLRTMLAMLGILVGTASVVALLSAGKLATEAALQQFRSLGINLMSLSLMSKDPGAVDAVVITADAYKNLPSVVSQIHLIAPYVTSSLTGSLGESSWDYSPIIGTTEEMAKIVNINIARGRFISNLDKNEFFCVAGYNMLKKMRLFAPLGKHVRLGNSIFTVIGIAKKWDMSTINMMASDINESLIIPLETALTITTSSKSITNAIILLYPDSDLLKVKAAITQYFADLYPQYQITIQSAQEIIGGIQVQQGIFTILLGFIGCISLVVGGIGVVNIMLASVAERRYEIGLRLALGAEPRDIEWMFLMEAAFLGIVGGLLGVILGLLSTLVISSFAQWNFTIFWAPPVIGFSVSLFVTLICGFYPALMASKTNPIDALRGT